MDQNVKEEKPCPTELAEKQTSKKKRKKKKKKGKGETEKVSTSTFFPHFLLSLDFH